MEYQWIDEYYLSKVGVKKVYKIEWQATRCMINDKMFAMQGGDKEGKSSIIVKLEPMFGELIIKK